MTASLLPNAKQQFIDANGNPLALGTVDFYVPGTTTRKNTWQDAGQTTLNTNPVVLDSAGEALIYGAGQYRQVVKDALGNLVWDQPTQDAAAAAAAAAAAGTYHASRALTAAGTVLASDGGNLIALGGNAFYALTFAAPGGYNPNHATTVVNTDAGRGKTIALTGGGNFILWPGQTAFVRLVSGAWVAQRPNRWKLPGPTTLYVDAANGLDANDGLAPGAALQTLGGAVMLVVHNQFDLTAEAAPQVAVQLADGTYPGLHLAGPFTGQDGNACVVVQGNAAAPGNTVVTANAGHGPIEMFNNARLEIKNLTIQNPSGHGVLVDSGAALRLMGGVVFDAAGAAAGGYAQVFARNGGMVFADYGYAISADAGNHVVTLTGGKFFSNGQTVTLTSGTAGAAYTYSAFAYCQQLGFQNWNGVTITLNGHTVSGQRYYVDTNGVIQTGTGNPNFLPGSTAGASPTGLYT